MAYGDRCAGVAVAGSLATGISNLKCRDLTNDQQEWRDIHTYIYNMCIYIYIHNRGKSDIMGMCIYIYIYTVYITNKIMMCGSSKK